MYESSKDAAARIRAQLKNEKGWNARDVTIRVEHYSMGSTIHATVRSARVSTHELKRIVETGESIRYDEHSGEILSGGNRFVDVHHTPEVQTILARRYIEALIKANDELEQAGVGNTLFPIEGTDPKTLIGWEHDWGGMGRRFWIDHAELAFNVPQPGDKYRESALEAASFHLALLLERKKVEASERLARVS